MIGIGPEFLGRFVAGGLTTHTVGNYTKGDVSDRCGSRQAFFGSQSISRWEE